MSLSYDDPQFRKNMNAVAKSLESAAGRTVKAQGLNAKDRTLAALEKYIDRPTPFTLRKGAYHASSPVFSGDEVRVTYTIARIQGDYLGPYIFQSSERRPGDPGTSSKHIWLPGFTTKNQYGGLWYGKTEGYFNRAKKDRKQAQARAEKYAARRAKGKTVNSGAWDRAHVAFTKLGGRGKGTYGFWLFPARKRGTEIVPVIRNGKPLRQKVTNRRGLNGRFTQQNVMRTVRRKIRTWFDLGEPILLAESRKVTRHTQRIDYDNAIVQPAREYGEAQYARYLNEELAKRGL